MELVSVLVSDSKTRDNTLWTQTRDLISNRVSSHTWYSVRLNVSLLPRNRVIEVMPRVMDQIYHADQA